MYQVHGKQLLSPSYMQFLVASTSSVDENRFFGTKDSSDYGENVKSLQPIVSVALRGH